MNQFYQKGRFAMASMIAASTVLTSFTAEAQTAPEGFVISDELFAAKGTSTDIPVGNSGTAANISDWNPASYVTSPTVAVFELKETNGETVYMRVNVTGVSGALASADTGFGIFRTTNSQGLMDTGSFSVYIAPMTSTSGAVSGEWSIGLQFSFFSSYAAGEDGAVGTFSDPRTTELILTTLDLDYSQKYFTSDESFGEYYEGANVTNTAPPVGYTDYTGFTATGNSQYDDEGHAVSSVMNSGLDSFDIALGHQGVALYMFELRNPPNISPMPDPVPEPGLMALAGIGGAALLVQRLRRRRA